MKTDKRSSIQVHNILIPVLVIILFLSVIFIYYSMIRYEAKEKMIKNCEISSISSSAQIDKILNTGTEALKLASYTLDNMLRSNDTQEEIREFLVNQTVALGYTDSAMTTGLYGYFNGEYLDGTDWVPDSDYVPVERPWYVGAMKNVDEIAVVDPYLDAMTGTITITFCKTLCDDKSVVAMDFSMELLQEVTESIIIQNESDIEMVIDQNYQVIAHSDKNEVGKKYLEEDGTFGNSLINKLKSSDDRYFSFNYNNAEYIVYAISVANDWYCISVFDATTDFSQIVNILVFTLISSSIIVVALLIIMIRSNKKQKDYERISSVVAALAASIDAKDPYTNGHSERVAKYAKEISRRHGDSSRTQEEVYMTGLLHDVGKIGIPDTLINKPGGLTDEEYDIVRKHPIIGANILSKISGTNTIAESVRHHHERFDGNGYPDKLSGTSIPSASRIVTVADAYDTMTSRRSYRDVLDQAKVRSEIERCKGTQFDPQYADIMIQMIDEDKEYQMRVKYDDNIDDQNKH